MPETIRETTDANNNRGTEYTLEVGDTFLGQTFGFREDWVAVPLEAGQAYAFTLSGVMDEGFDQPAMRDVNLGINGRLRDFLFFEFVTQVSDEETFETLESTSIFVAPRTATYYLSVSSNGFQAGGAYELETSLAPGEGDTDAADDVSTEGAVEIGNVLFGQLDDGDTGDWFAVTLDAGVNYAMGVVGNSLIDPVLALYDEAGVLIQEIDDLGGFAQSLNPNFNYAVSETGTYYLGVRGARDGDTGGYRINVVETQDAFGTGSNDRMVVQADDLSLFGEAGDDTLVGGDKRDFLNGGAGNDILIGGRRGDDLSGEEGDDKVLGGRGNDNLRGGGGDDTLRGGGGLDFLGSSSGNDVMAGGPGADQFAFNSAFGTATILDFELGVDLLSLDRFAIGTQLLSKEEILDRYLSVVDGNAVFDFKFGKLTLNGVTDLETLAAVTELF